jgi:hypothetical protein
MTATDGEPVFLTDLDADVLPAIPDRRLERFVGHHGRAGVAADVSLVTHVSWISGAVRLGY